jgi:hypothetical protein
MGELWRDETGEPPWEFHRLGDLGEMGITTWGRVEGHSDWAYYATFVIEDDVRLIGLQFQVATYARKLVLGTDVLRSIRLSDLYKTARNAADLAGNEGLGIKLKVDRDSFGKVLRTGRVGRNDKFYAEIAARYVEEVATGNAPLKRLAEREHFDESTVRAFLNKARRRGLLTAAPPGRAGGRLTPKALALLESVDR